MLWLKCVVISGLTFTFFVVWRHGLRNFSVFFVENTLTAMTAGGLVLGTAVLGRVKVHSIISGSI